MVRETYVSRTEQYYESRKKPEDFMDDEVTISHLLRKRNHFTKDSLSFGAQLAKNLLERGFLPEKPRILEMGPGLGDIAESMGEFLDWNFEYTFLDNSARLIKHLKSRFLKRENFRFVQKDCLSLPSGHVKFDLVICNEVLGDLPTIVNMNKDTLENNMKGNFNGISLKNEDLVMYRDSVRIIMNYNLDFKDPPENFNFNYGALRFLEETFGILDKKGLVFLSEHSCDPGWPERLPLFGHEEYTVKFDFLETVAKKLGFRIETGQLTDFLGINKNRKCVSMILQPELRSIYGFLKEHGGSEILKLGMRALTIEEFLELVKKHRDEISVTDLDSYEKFLEREAKPLGSVTDKFRYMILRK